jgi:hypothetical protein
MSNIENLLSLLLAQEPTIYTTVLDVLNQANNKYVCKHQQDIKCSCAGSTREKIEPHSEEFLIEDLLNFSKIVIHTRYSEVLTIHRIGDSKRNSTMLVVYTYNGNTLYRRQVSAANVVKLLNWLSCYMQDIKYDRYTEKYDIIVAEGVAKGELYKQLLKITNVPNNTNTAKSQAKTENAAVKDNAKISVKSETGKQDNEFESEPEKIVITKNALWELLHCVESRNSPEARILGIIKDTLLKCYANNAESIVLYRKTNQMLFDTIAQALIKRGNYVTSVTFAMLLDAIEELKSKAVQDVIRKYATNVTVTTDLIILDTQDVLLNYVKLLEIQQAQKKRNKQRKQADTNEYAVTRECLVELLYVMQKAGANLEDVNAVQTLLIKTYVDNTKQIALTATEYANLRRIRETIEVNKGK